MCPFSLHKKNYVFLYRPPRQGCFSLSKTRTMHFSIIFLIECPFSLHDQNYVFLYRPLRQGFFLLSLQELCIPLSSSWSCVLFLCMTKLTYFSFLFHSNLTVTGIFLFVVFLMCPLVIYFVQTLTSDIQNYAQILVNKTKDLHREMRKTDSLLYQVVPASIADKLKKNEIIDAEYFKSTTIMFSEIVGFTQVSVLHSPLEIVEMLNILYSKFDDQVSKYNVYKVETINDAYMIASGVYVDDSVRCVCR